MSINKKGDRQIIVYPYSGIDTHSNIHGHQILCYMKETRQKRENTVESVYMKNQKMVALRNRRGIDLKGHEGMFWIGRKFFILFWVAAYRNIQFSKLIKLLT